MPSLCVCLCVSTLHCIHVSELCINAISMEDSNNKSSQFHFCPLCQAPLVFLRISPLAHVSSCSVTWDSLPHCPDGKDCLNKSIFHYRDYSHFELATYRSSSSYVTPSIETLAPVSTKKSPKVVKKLNYTKTTKQKQDESNDNCLYEEEGDNLLKSEKLNDAICSKRHENKSKINIRLDNSINTGSSDDEISFFKKDKKISKRPAKSPVKSTKTVSKKIKVAKNNLKNTRKQTKVKNFSDVSNNEVSVCSDIVLNKNKNSVAQTYKEENIIKSDNMQQSQSLNRSENKDNYFSDCIGNFSGEISDKEKVGNMDDDISFSQNFNNKTVNLNFKSSEGNVNKPCNFSEEEIDFGEEPCFTSSPKQKNRSLSCSSSSASVSYSPLESNESTQLCFKMSDLSPLKTMSNVNTIENKVVNNKISPVKTVGVFVPKTESKRVVTISKDSENASSSEDINDKSVVNNLGISKKKHESGSEIYHSEPCENSVSNKLKSKKTVTKIEVEFSNEKSVSSGKTTGRSIVTRSDTAKFMSKFRQPGDICKSKGKWKGASKNETCSAGASSNLEQCAEFEEPFENGTEILTTVKATRSVRRRNTTKKICPFYKLIPDAPIAVDAFNYGYIQGVRSYFLTHFHSDHYIGLKKTFDRPIFCSAITANLVKMQIGVDEKWLNVIDVGERRIVNGTEVVALDANHCPGSLMFLFQLRTGQNYLHVGDFRFHSDMENCTELKHLHINKLFLDTTYCKPEYDFPTQNDIINEVVNIVHDELKINQELLIVCGSYLIGKEKVFSAVAKASNSKIWTESYKKRIYKCVNDPDIVDRFADNALLAQVHVLGMNNVTFEKLYAHLRKHSNYSRIIAFRPTGWTAKSSGAGVISKRVQGNVTIYDVPYSEHSSFSELRRFVQFMRPDEIIPTVNVGTPAARDEMDSYFKSWLVEQKQPQQTSLLDYISKKK